MPDRADTDWLLDILEEADLIATATSGSTFEQFSADPVLQRAVLHMLQTIGEAANHLSSPTLATMSTVPWPLVRGLRNRIVHGYFGLDLGAVWLTATAEAPRLAAAVRASGLI
ncbi:MAG: DUF86 domain-containing protein [Hyphomonadaceae bacterium]|nr:DUF86 domain-containing protein [Hyphomonadaceae bacterium]